MTMRGVAMVAAVGIGLLGATVQQAMSTSGNSKPSAGASRVVARGVAAEGRVMAYPGADVVVGTERAGRLLSTRFQEGQQVRKGDLLAELDSEELRATLQEAKARVSEAEAEIRLADANLKRRQQLVEQQIVAANDLDQARRDIETARARKETAAAEAERYEAQIRKTRVLAPISGSVLTRHVDAGETIEAMKPVYTIADLSRLRIEAEADEADAAAIALRAPVTITAEGYPDQSWQGTVEEIADSVTIRKLKPQDPSRPTDTRILTVKVAFAEKSPLKLGTTVELRIQPKR